MSASRSLPAAATPAGILVVDDDRRVRELLEVALTAHGFRVLTAVDGEEAVKRALGERPDLVVLDVRLPKKSGLEVCETLRGDPEDPSVPIILVSAAAETDARLQAFSRGADDYLAKPFSPKELIARIKRLLTRNAETRAARHRADELEHELARAQDEARRAHYESRREQTMREIAYGLGCELHRTNDLDVLAERLLIAVRSKLGVKVAALWTPERSETALGPIAIRGDAFDRIATLEMRLGGELLTFLGGLGRPALAAELERIPELRAEIAPFLAQGFALLVPLRSPQGIEALLATDEKGDGGQFTRADVELLDGVGTIAAIAIHNCLGSRAQVDRMIALMAEQAPHSAGGAVGREEAEQLILAAARTLTIVPRTLDLLRHGVALGRWATTSEGSSVLDRSRALDPTGRIGELMRLLEQAVGAGSAGDLSVPPGTGGEDKRAGALLGAGLMFAEARVQGSSIESALATAFAEAGGSLDDDARAALSTAARELDPSPDRVA